MSHVLIVELPGGNDTDILVAALAGGDRFSLLTADPDHYYRQSETAALLERADNVLPAGDFDPVATLALVQKVHRCEPFDAILCLQDLRIVETALLARALGLRHLNPETALLCRNKAAVRQRLARTGLAQPPFRIARGSGELARAIDELGLPLIVKPVDGFGSQSIFALRTEEDAEALLLQSDLFGIAPENYGLGVAPRGEMLVERLFEGQLVGCDTMSASGRHMLLGVNEKLFFAPPSFAIRGGCLTTNHGQLRALEEYTFAVLERIGFDHGAAHIEVMLTPDGPRLVEVNPRLVGARIPRLISAARGRSVHQDLIALHGKGLLPPASTQPAHAVSRWLAAPAVGTLGAMVTPSLDAPGILEVNLLHRVGHPVTPPFDNADRLGYVMTVGPNRQEAEARADAFISATQINVIQRDAMLAV